MRLTYDLLKAIYESHPNAAHAEQVSGLTSGQAAALVLLRMNNAPDQRSRDAIMVPALAVADIITTGEAAFDKGSEQWLRDMAHPQSAERESVRLAEQSRSSGQYVSPERIRHLRDVAAHASLQQGLSDRMRAADRKRGDDGPLRVSERDVAHAEDTRDRRSAIIAAVNTVKPKEVLTLDHYGDRSLRESLSDAFDAHAGVEAERDPLEDPGLRSLSNAV